MEVTVAAIPGVLLFTPKFLHDARGYFVETFSQRVAETHGLTKAFLQDNQSFSIRAGTVRGLHFQIPPTAQAKLVRVLHGSIYDVAVDLRAGSPSYGRWTAATLTARGGEQLFVPRGFAHGLCTLEPDTLVAYKVDAYYAPESERGLAWDDPELAINWPIRPEQAILSDNDRNRGRLADFVSPFRYDGA